MHSVDFKCTILVADASDEISNKFIKVFKKCEKRIVCWAHVIRYIDRTINVLKKEKENKKKLRMDIINLHLLPTETVFNAAVKFLENKWEKNPKAKEVIEYVKKQWINKNIEWYEGYAVGFQKNNVLEANNRQICGKENLWDNF